MTPHAPTVAALLTTVALLAVLLLAPRPAGPPPTGPQPYRWEDRVHTTAPASTRARTTPPTLW